MAKVPAIELVRLLNHLRNNRVRIKFRMTDRIWQTEFLKILAEHTPDLVYVHDGKNHSCVMLKDVSEFELEEVFEGFDARIRYEVLNDK